MDITKKLNEVQKFINDTRNEHLKRIEMMESLIEKAKADKAKAEHDSKAAFDAMNVTDYQKYQKAIILASDELAMYEAKLAEIRSMPLMSKDQYDHLEYEMQDLLHYIEMGSDKNANAGYKSYKRLAEIRRERRSCKNEMDLLQPIYDAFGGGDKLNVLAQIQGSCRVTKQSIDNRAYTVRTDILESFIDKGRD